MKTFKIKMFSCDLTNTDIKKNRLFLTNMAKITRTIQQITFFIVPVCSLPTKIKNYDLVCCMEKCLAK